MKASDVKGWYNRVNVVLKRHGIAQITVPSITAGETTAVTSHLNNIKTAIENQKKDAYLGTLSFSTMDSVAKDNVISSISKTQIENNVVELEKAVCRNTYTCQNSKNTLGVHQNGVKTNGMNSFGEQSNGSFTDGTKSNGKYHTSTHGNGQSGSGVVYGNGSNFNGDHSNGDNTNGSHDNGSQSNGTMENGKNENGAHDNGTCAFGSAIDVKNSNT